MVARIASESQILFPDKNIWEMSGKQVNLASISPEKALKLVMNRISKESKVKILWKYWQRVAAIIIFPILLLPFLKKTEIEKPANISFNEVFAAYGTRSSIKLADGSTVWLNSGSKFKYPDKFTNNNRVVYLVGEAYFEVKSDIRKPFIVQAGTMQVKATGTKFNVQAYKINRQTEVTLVTGKVSVSRNQVNNNQLIAELKPNENLTYDTASAKHIVKEIDTYKYISWKDGKLIFRNEPMINVLKKLGILYNVQFELHGNELKNYRYRATFENETLDEILKIIKASSPIDYIQYKRTPLPDGTIPKQKIAIFLKK